MAKLDPQIDNEASKKLLELIEKNNLNKQQQEFKPTFTMPQALMPKKKKAKLDELGNSATIRELTTLDYIIVKKMLSESKQLDDETLSMFLTAMTIESLETVNQKGVIEKCVLPPVESLDDLMARMTISPSLWIKISEISSELNNINPETLKK